MLLAAFLGDAAIWGAVSYRRVAYFWGGLPGAQHRGSAGTLRCWGEARIYT